MKINYLTFIFSLALILSSCNYGDSKSEQAMPDNAAVAEGLYNAFAEGDVETVLAGLHPEVTWNEAENFIYADGNPYVGHDAVVNGVFARLGAEWEYWTLENKKYMNLTNGMVLVTGRYKAKLKTTGGEIDAQFAHLWTFTDGLASNFQQYVDTKQVAEVYHAENGEASEGEEDD
jgi:ketosteroid isomerase-like protein